MPSEVCTELESYLGFADKILAEFITELGRDCQSVDVVRTLLTVIRAILPLNVKKEEKRFRDKDRCSGRDRGDERTRRRPVDGRGRRDQEYVDNNKSRGRLQPELYQDKGKVQRVMDTGCFVLLEFSGKEGLVHVSQMATRRIVNAKDVVKRNQEVYVKVISIANHKLSLSMRDVDQNTGQDLLPLKNNNNMTNPSTLKIGGLLAFPGSKLLIMTMLLFHPADP